MMRWNEAARTGAYLSGALAALVATAACASADPTPPSTPAPKPIAPQAALDAGAPKAVAAVDAGESDPNAESRRVARMLKKVASARKLAAKREVPGVVLDRPGLLARVKAHVDREVPKEAIVAEGAAMKLLGLIPTDFDYEKETYALLEAQLAGYYEPEDRSMYMAADLDNDNAKATLAHELVHALQDQHWDLGARSKYKQGQGDLSSSTSALAEGDATSAMFDVMLAGTGRTALDLPEDVFTEQIIESVSQGPSGRAPHAMRAALVAPYVYGTLFVHALRRRGGWELVNRAWERPPTSSEQILHPEKWIAEEAPIAVPAPPIASLGAGYAVVENDTFGELGTGLTFAEWMDETVAKTAALDWGGDRATLTRSGDAMALGWRITYDAPRAGAANKKRASERAFAAITQAFAARGSAAARKDASFACFNRPEIGPLGVLHGAGGLVIVAGPTKAAKAGKWTSTGDCATSEKWAKEIAAAR